MSRPNFLVIMTDQQRGDCLGIDGHPVLLTPNLDAIACDGVRFSRAYSTCPVCVPARRSFLTGQFPATHGGHTAAGMQAEWQAPTLASALSQAGYHTCWVGRSMHQTPVRKRHGFDHMVIFDYRIHDDYDEWIGRREPEGGGGYYGTGVMHNDWTARPWHMEEAYHKTNWTVNEALRFLRTRDPSCPFFLVVSFIAPHPPLVPPAFYMERYLRQELPAPVIGDWATPPLSGGVGDDVSADSVNLTGEALRSCRAGYYGLINHVDDQIRRLWNPVTGLDRGNTVVIVTSDHGEMLGDHYLWRKSLPYEGSARIPLLVRAPEQFGIKSRTVLDQPVGLEDIMPTVLEMAGLPVPESVEGSSLLPLMRTQEVAWRPWIRMELPPRWYGLTDGKEKYVQFPVEGREQLFELSSDPTECHDLSRDRAARPRLAMWRDRLAQELNPKPRPQAPG